MVSAPPKEEGGYGVSNSHHISCFKIPRKLNQGGNKCDGPEDFVDDYLEDHSPNHDLLTDGEKKDEIIQKLKEAQEKTKKKKKVEGEDGNNIMSRLKVAYKEGKTGEEEPASKKAKLKSTSEEDEFQVMLGLYPKYSKMTVEGLKDFLSWNGQIQKGNKDFRLFKVIDGELHGRLSQCPLCQGNLKFIEEDYDKVCFIELTYIYIYEQVSMDSVVDVLTYICSFICTSICSIIFCSCFSKRHFVLMLH